MSTASSNHTSPSLSPPTSPPPSQDAAMPPSTPSPTSVPMLATSPHINKFLAREPPDGCERVALKLHEDRYYGVSLFSTGFREHPTCPKQVFHFVNRKICYVMHTLHAFFFYKLYSNLIILITYKLCVQLNSILPCGLKQA